MNSKVLRKIILGRFLWLIPTLLGIVTLVFFMIAFIPGDPARVMLGERASAEQLERLREQLGLDKPLIVQYGNYILRMLRLDLGTSIRSGQNILHELLSFFPATVELAVVAILFASVLGIFLGVLAAIKKHSWVDYTASSVSLIGISMPIYWLGLILIMFFSVHLNLFPTGSRINTRYSFDPITGFYLIDSLVYIFKTGSIKYFTSSLRHIVLPSITLGLLPLASIMRITRTSMLEVMKQDYIKTVQAMGISARKIVCIYALKNALLPIITIIGLQFGILLSGAFLTETIFAWPGLGKWLYESISARDFPAVQGGVFFIATVFVLINLLVDILYMYINPKISVQ